MSKKVYKYISEKMSEKILDIKTCKWCNEEYPIFEREKIFLDKHNFSVSRLCFDCRIRNMLIWRNEKKIFWRKSDMSGKKILSLFRNDNKLKVYDYDEWNKSGGFSEIFKVLDKSDFMKSYYELLQEVPYPGTDIFWSHENIWYCNRVGNIKNAYLTFCCFGDSEDIYFSIYVSFSKDVYTSTDVYNSGLVYDSTVINDSYSVFFSDNIEESKYIYFSYDLKNCTECIFCSNLNSKKYMVYNKQYTESEYLKIKNILKSNTSSYKSLEKLLKDFEELKLNAFRKGTNNIGGEKNIGDNLKNSNNNILGFWMNEADNCFNAAKGFPAYQKNIFNSFGFGLVENMNFVSGSGPGTNLFFSLNIEDGSDIYFSQKLKGCHNCIGCFGLQNADFHILNKAYSKEDYEKLSKEIFDNLKKSGNLGDFLDPKYSPFPINDSQIFLEYPIYSIRKLKNYRGGDFKKCDYEESIVDTLGKGILYILNPEKDLSDAILDLGGIEKIITKWKSSISEINIPEDLDVISWENLEDNIHDFDVNILSKAIICKESGRYFRSIKKELDFCKKHSIALSRIHPDIRLDYRKKRITKLGIDLIECCICKSEILSVYDKKSGNIVCEDCYNKKVY